jgi:hypothetical protein
VPEPESWTLLSLRSDKKISRDPDTRPRTQDTSQYLFNHHATPSICGAIRSAGRSSVRGFRSKYLRSVSRFYRWLAFVRPDAEKLCSGEAQLNSLYPAYTETYHRGLLGRAMAASDWTDGRLAHHLAAWHFFLNVVEPPRRS